MKQRKKRINKLISSKVFIVVIGVSLLCGCGGLKMSWQVKSGQDWNLSRSKTIYLDSNHIVLAGYQTDSETRSSSGVVVKYDSAGKQAWKVNFDNAGFSDVVEDHSGDLLVSGTYGVDSGSGYQAQGLIVVKYSSEGQLLWESRVNSSEFKRIQIAIDSNDGVLVYFNADEQWHIVKHNATGDQLWQFSHPGAKESRAFLQVDSQGNSYLAGEIDDVVHLIQVDSAGQFSWGRSGAGDYGTPAFTNLSWLDVFKVDNADRILLAGARDINPNDNDLSTQLTVLQFEDNGELNWQSEYTFESESVESNMRAGQMLIDSQNNSYISVQLKSLDGVIPCDALGPGGVCPVGREFDVLVKFDETGDLLWDTMVKGESFNAGKLDFGARDSVFLAHGKRVMEFGMLEGEERFVKALPNPLNGTRNIGEIHVDSNNDFYIARHPVFFFTTFELTKFKHP